MKKTILLSIGLFSLLSVQAQLEWAPVGAKYYYSTANYMGTGTPFGVSVKEVSGDTLIAGKNCRILGTWSPGCGIELLQFTYEEEGRVYY